MPVRIPDHLPAAEVLESENIFVMSETRAANQDIRPMKVLILNLMPNKIETETQLLRLLGNTPLQVDVDLLRIHDKESKHTSIDHMNTFYRDFEAVRHRNYDGLIITGAPLGQIDFEDVVYWDHIREIIDWSQEHVTSVLFLCWAAHAGLYHLYGLNRKILQQKRSGVFVHRRTSQHFPLLRGFDDEFFAPHSRFAEMDIEEIRQHPQLQLLAESDEAGAYLVLSRNNRNLFVMGHPEYQKSTLNEEYQRDLSQGLDPNVPQNYYRNDDPKADAIARWHSHGSLLVSNWLNYYVYQLTPYDLSDMTAMTPWESR
ncbi:homoserine O-acetyltransferase MetA [Shewanella baltica]|uniref:homoserine O-acetyltransferase MetA n=1 Tax=Shewanella baltica TaxID=62322 RepID=UPI000D19CF37|nr:homoserine O-succinyltransferase [Shewanella baltica]AVT46340.1 homoserine O-succinyltransferase [Shewanella baltica]MCS6094993.1 homoserine O-succinyltransferase [Shewanella baltica]MCS6099228.1 homoserine O-succinyltransferase [Shewanella baltica]MCS6182705.1 homoserine O-succinyltransferase [Shewanella baltica]MCS6225349.1 homoserine O-succinyltransferase [Shewanella baltica]